MDIDWTLHCATETPFYYFLLQGSCLYTLTSEPGLKSTQLVILLLNVIQELGLGAAR